ncbi:MAG: hypothetical protein ACTSQK_12165 [Candidatus Heimdallarchaeota archaeon]
MSSFDVERKKPLDMLIISENNNELFELLTEYLKLRYAYDEPLDAKRMRERAEECLREELLDYDRAYKLLKLAMKIMKACNGIN